MSGSDYSLNMAINASNNASGVISNFISSLGPIGGAVAGISAAVVGIGVASTIMAGKYDQSMRSVQALNGVNNDQMKQYDDGLKKLAVEAGVGPQKLTAGLNTVLGASYTGKDALTVLTLATKDAVIGLTDAGTTTNALTTILKGFSIPVKDAAAANGEMLQTVTLGKMTMGDYASAIGKAATTSKHYNVSMEDMNATIATLTSNGVPNAKQAVTDYNQAVTVMDGNIGTVSKSLNKSGIAFDKAKFNTLDYTGKLHMLGNALQIASDKHIKVTGATQQAMTAIQIANQHSQEFTKDLKQLSNQQNDAAATSKAWAITQGGFNQTMNRLGATIDVVMISIGQKLLPVVTKLANQIIPIVAQIGDWLIKSGTLDTVSQGLANGIADLVAIIVKMVNIGTGVVSFFQHNQLAMDALKSVVVGLGIAMTLWAMTQIPVMIGALTAWAIAQWAVVAPVLATAAPFILIGLLVAGVVFGIIEIVKNWGAISKWLQQAWSNSLHAIGSFFSWLGTHVHQILGQIGSTIGGFFSEVGTKVHDGLDAIGNFFKAAWDWLLTAAKIAFVTLVLIIIGPIGDLVILIVTHWTQIKSFLATTWTWITNLAGNAWQALVNIITTRIQNAKNNITNWWGDIRSFFANLPGEMETWGIDMIQGLINGITSMIGNLTSKVQGVAQSIAKFLHFTKPDEGPLVTVDEWMPHMGDTLIEGLNTVTPKLQASALRAAMAVATPFSSGKTGSPSHIFDFIGSDYNGYASGVATTHKREAREKQQLERLEAILEKHIQALEEPSKTPKLKTAKERAAYERERERKEAELQKEEANIQKLEQHYHITVNHTGKGKWTKQDAEELAALTAHHVRLQGKHPQTASGRRN